MTLSDTQVRNIRPAEKAKKYSDGGGLHLLVASGGGKLWRFSYRFGGKQKTLSLGAYPVITLAEAREKRLDAKRVLTKGSDPAELMKIAKAKQVVARSSTFEAVAEELLAKAEKEGKSETTLAKKRWLLEHVRHELFARPIAEISAAEILVPLKQVEQTGKYETTRRLRATIGQVFRYAIATARAENDPTFGLRGALITPKVSHMAALTDWPSFVGLLRAIWSYSGTTETTVALKLMALLYPRPGELRQAEWAEFDLAKGEWSIPAERMKMRRPHKKPLPPLAISLLRELREVTGDRRLAFPSIQNPDRPLSENTMNLALRRMGFEKGQATSHGFRATASTLLNESGLWSADAIEAELAHVSGDEVRRAYHRALYWDERAKMTEWWSGQLVGKL